MTIRRLMIAALLLGLVSGACGGDTTSRRIVIGTTDADPVPAPEPGPPEVDAPEVAPDTGPTLAAPDSGGPPTAIAYHGGVDVPDHLRFFLVAGSDARPGQPVDRTRADSLHVVAVNPQVGRGTVLGLPRDSYVDVPGHGRRKINSALALGGPDLLVRTVRDLTGFPVEAYAVTGFDGIVRIVDELGGLDVYVPYAMNDRFSGARFEEGWHRMDGREVLAFSRNRHVPGGDFARSEHQGEVILHALSKMRGEVSDEGGIRRWVDVLFRHARLDMSVSDAVRLGTFARSLDRARFRNVVAPGDPRSVGGQSVVVLASEAYRLFRDVGADGIADGREGDPVAPPPSTPTPAPTPTPTPTPRPSPTPAPTPTPTPILDL